MCACRFLWVSQMSIFCSASGVCIMSIFSKIPCKMTSLRGLQYRLLWNLQKSTCIFLHQVCAHVLIFSEFPAFWHPSGTYRLNSNIMHVDFCEFHKSLYFCIGSLHQVCVHVVIFPKIPAFWHPSGTYRLNSKWAHVDFWEFNKSLYLKIKKVSK